MVDLHAQQAMTDARMAEDRRRAQRARYLRRGRRPWLGLPDRFRPSRAGRRDPHLRQAA